MISSFQARLAARWSHDSPPSCNVQLFTVVEKKRPRGLGQESKPRIMREVIDRRDEGTGMDSSSTYSMPCPLSEPEPPNESPSARLSSIATMSASISRTSLGTVLSYMPIRSLGCG